ncbi:hypothetical protein D3C79_997730 [compost metagenome]
MPVISMSSTRGRRILVGWPVRCAITAHRQAGLAAWVSLPPKPPPMRRMSTTILFIGTSRTSATSFCTSVGFWVEQ